MSEVISHMFNTSKRVRYRRTKTVGDAQHLEDPGLTAGSSYFINDGVDKTYCINL